MKVAMKNILTILSMAVIFGSSYAPTLHAAESMVTKEIQMKLLQEQIASMQKQLQKLNDSDDGGTLSDAEKLEILKVRESDHTRGDLDAPVVFFVYSDFESPFEKVFHDTLLKVYKNYGKQGDVLWVQRNFPIIGLFPNSLKIAGATECVAHLNGNDAYWKFVDKLSASRKVKGHSSRPTDVAPIDMAKLSGYAKSVGVDSKKFKTCFTKNTYRDDIEKSVDEGTKLGVRGVPQTAVVYDGDLSWISGAQSYNTVKDVIEGDFSAIEE